MPYLSAATPNVSATLLSPHGPIRVDASRTIAGSVFAVRVTVESPLLSKGGYVGLRMTDEATECRIDLTTATLDGAAVGATVGAPEGVSVDLAHPHVVAKHAYVAAPAGRHMVRVEYPRSCASVLAPPSPSPPPPIKAILGKGLPDVPPFRPTFYPGKWSIDNMTGGAAWIGRYGSAGFQLFGFNSDGSDVVRLPSWVNSVEAKKGRSQACPAAFVGSDSANSSFLADPSRLGPSSLGFVTAGADGSQGTVLDVNVTSEKTYRLALYMVSSVKPVTSNTWSATRQAIRVMDLRSLDPIAPDAYMEHFEGGLYWVLEYHHGVRLRVMPIDSDAGFSAVFFDQA